MSSNTVEKVQAKDLKEYKAFFKEIKEKIVALTVAMLICYFIASEVVLYSEIER